MKCRKCHKETESNEDVFNGFCEECFLEKLFPENNEQKQSLSKFEDLSFILDGFEAIVLEGELSISNEPEKIDRFTKMRMDVENTSGLSKHEQEVLVGRIVYLGALTHIQSKDA